MRLQPDDAVVYLQAAKLCYEHLDMVRDLVVLFNQTYLNRHLTNVHFTLSSN